MRIGVCGMGKMGSAIARRLMTLGHGVTVWNRDAAKTVPLVAEGASAAASPGDLASAVEMVITIVLDAGALDAVYRGAQGLLSAKLAGKLVVDMSTVLPETEAAIGADVVRHAGGFVECPVSGTVAPAREGRLFGFAGGTDDDVARARPVLDQLCRRVEHVGAVGNGARVKLAVNLPLLVYWQALGEAISLCKSVGLPPERLIDILGDTTGAANGIKGGDRTSRGAWVAPIPARDRSTWSRRARTSKRCWLSPPRWASNCRRPRRRWAATKKQLPRDTSG